jgi:hypothetical protein
MSPSLYGLGQAPVLPEFVQYLHDPMKGISMRIISTAVALCCTLLLAACFPPITAKPVGHDQADLSLRGLWRATMTHGDPGQDRAWFHFVPQSDGSTLVIIVSGAKKGDADVMGATVRTAKLGGSQVMNARLVSFEVKGTGDDSEQPPGTIPVLYRHNGKHLSLFLMDEKATKAAIASGRIKGSVGSGDYGDATITADQPELDRFLSSAEGQALFSDKFAEMTMVE